MPQYFTQKTDENLAKYIASTEDAEKHRIFVAEIKPAFDKLIENLIFVYGFYTLDDVDTLKRECLSDLYRAIPKYDPTRGKKGFSYFNVVAKNWFVQKTREKKKRDRTESELRTDIDNESVKNDRNLAISPYETLVEEREFWTKFHDEMGTWRERLAKKSERQVLDAVIFIMRNPDLVTIYNKKAVYLYLRELTGLNTKQVVTNFKKIRELYERWKESYLSTGESRI